MENSLFTLEKSLLNELNQSKNPVIQTNYICSHCKCISNKKSNEDDVLKEFVQALVSLQSNPRELTKNRTPQRWQSLSTNNSLIPESSDDEKDASSPEISFGEEHENDPDTGYDTLTIIKEPLEKKQRISLSESSFDLNRRSWLKIILKCLENEKMIQSLIERRVWIGSLLEQAVEVVLDSVKLDLINSKIEIIKSMVQVIDRILQSKELNKNILWSYHLNVMSELCDNSVEICVDALDFLIVDRLQTMNDREKNKNKNDSNYYHEFHDTVKNAHILFYALDIIMKKFHRMIPKEVQMQSNEKRLLRIVDWWQECHRFPATEFRMMDLISKKKQWINILEEFSAIHVEKCPQFVFKAQQLSLNLQE